MTSERFCLACGADLPGSAAFCSACGAKQADEADGAEALIGTVIDGRFRVLRLLGTGGMGAVYLAEHTGIGRRVAVKVLRAELRDQKDLVRRFRREITAVSRLADAHTVTVFDSGMWRGLVYLVMEYLRGVDLATTLDAEGRLSLERALRITCQIGSSLTEAHQQGIVHRDLKPENIFLTRSAGGEELVKVLDFGLAKIMTDEAPGEASFQTQKGILLGTPWYMAPEQIEGGEVGPATDLYALGALLFRMLAGRPAFSGNSPMQVLESHLKADRPVLDAPGVPPEVAALVGRMLARKATDRPRRALEVVGIILEFLPGEHTPDWALATAPHEQPPLNAQALRVPSSFSTSGVAPAPPVVEATDDSLPATRDEFDRYERKLGQRGRRRLGVAALALAGAVGVGLLLIRPTAPPTREVEPNDDPHTASPLAVGVPLRGFLGRRMRPEHSDLDYFRLEASRGGLHARVSGVPGIDLVIDGFDGTGQRLIRLNAAGPGQGEAGLLPAPVAWLLVREYWVAGRAPSENSTDAYVLEVTGLEVTGLEVTGLEGEGTLTWPAADVWLHGASVGDQRALAPLVSRLHAVRPDLRLLVTAWTQGGLVVGGQLFPDRVRRVPLSVAWGPDRVLRAVGPRVVVFEYLELWPAWVAACVRQGVGSLVVDGRVGPRSLRIRPLLARAAGRLDAFCARSDRDAHNARALGVRPACIWVHGNAKYDGTAAAAPAPERGLVDAVGPVDVVVGSLHPDEERDALPALASSGLRVLIAPRYPKRSAAIVRAAARWGVSARLRSQPVDPRAKSAQWVVLDTFGELASAYALGPVAIVGGTFGRRQGQTLVEPAAHGCRVVHGPATDNIAEEVAALDGRGAWPVGNWAEACARVQILRTDPGLDPRPALAILRGAAERNLSTLLAILDRYPRPPTQLASPARVDRMG